METAREYADRIHCTAGMSDNELKEIRTSLSMAIWMMEEYGKRVKEEADEKAKAEAKAKAKAEGTKGFNRHNWGWRVVAFPAIVLLMLIGHVRGLVLMARDFIWYGGEWINFRENERKNVVDIYAMLKEMKEAPRPPEGGKQEKDQAKAEA